MIAQAPIRRRATDMAKRAAKKAGRPPKEESERYTKPMSVWFTDAQLTFVDRAVEAAGLSRAEFLRRSALGQAETVLGESAP